jgi:hypothetical protein
VLQAQQDDRNIVTRRDLYLDVGNVALTDAHLWRKYLSHREVSSENLKCEALIRRVAFTNPFSVKIKNMVISMLLELSITYTNLRLIDFQMLIISQPYDLY